MRKVMSYVTSDGKIHTDKAAATLHEASLTLINTLRSEYEAIFKVAPDAARILTAMVAEPEVFLTALQTFAKAKKKHDGLKAAEEASQQVQALAA